MNVRVVRSLAVAALALTLTLGIGGTWTKAATSEATFETVNCMIAQGAFDFASEQLLDAPRGSRAETYWQHQVGYWAGYMVGAGC